MHKCGLMAAAAALMLTAANAHAESLIETDGLRASPNSVKVGAVTADKAGYVVVHEVDQNGAATGDVIGFARIHQGKNAGISIPLGKKMKPGVKLVVMLHAESSGDRELDPADAPVTAGAKPVQQTVTVE